jgi:glutaredoxin-related protein
MKKIFSRKKLDSIPDLIEDIEENLEKFEQFFAEKKEEMFKELDHLFSKEFEDIHIFIKGSPGDLKCKFTRELMGILEPYAFKFSYFDILENEDIRNWNRLYSGWKTYP